MSLVAFYTGWFLICILLLAFFNASSKRERDDLNAKISEHRKTDRFDK